MHFINVICPKIYSIFLYMFFQNDMWIPLKDDTDLSLTNRENKANENRRQNKENEELHENKEICFLAKQNVKTALEDAKSEIDNEMTNKIDGHTSNKDEDEEDIIPDNVPSPSISLPSTPREDTERDDENHKD